MEEKIDFRSLVLEDEETTARPVEKARKRGAAPEFGVVLNSNPDFAVRKRTAKTSKLLVVLVSQGQMYVKDEKSGDVLIVMRLRDDEDRLAVAEGWRQTLVGFLRGMPAGFEVPGQWLRNLEPGARFADMLAEAMSRPFFLNAARSGLLACVAPELEYPSLFAEAAQQASDFALAHAALARDVKRLAGERPDLVGGGILAMLPSLAAVDSAFGVDDARKFAGRLAASLPVGDWNGKDWRSREMREGRMPDGDALADVFRMPADWDEARAAGVRVDTGYNHRSHELDYMASRGGFERLRLDYGRFEDYVFGQARREGMDLDICSWTTTWRDDLMQQLLVHGHVVDKYPDNLLSHHQKVSREWAQMSSAAAAADDAEKWERAAGELAAYDWTPEGGELRIVHPTCTADMVAEAEGQGNCLRSYIDGVRERMTDILFCRRADQPERPFVTLEVRYGHLSQAYARYNKRPDRRTQEFLRDWCEAKGIAWDQSWLPAVAA